MSDITIRAFNPDSEADYASLSDVMRAAKPEYPMTVAELRDQDGQFGEFGTKWNRWLATDTSGMVVGYSSFVPMIWSPGPGKYYPGLGVRPEWQGQGIGKSLYAVLGEELQKHDPTYLKVEWREDMERGVRFFTERGYQEVGRYYESRLNIASFDFAPFAEDFDKPLAHGITIHSWRERKASDPDADYKLWEAVMDISPDVPSDEPFEPMSFDTFQTVIMNRPNIHPDGCFVAVDRKNGRYAGISHIWLRQADNDLDTGLTGVRKEYRRLGIALALKLRILRWAQASGFQVLRTGNEVNNRPMLSINERLGFEKIPPWIEFVWRPEGKAE